MKKSLFFLFAMVFGLVGWGQSTANYTFSYITNGSLVDISVGATSLMSGNNDDAGSTLQNIGFTFYFMGTPYTQFSANSNGQLRLGSTLVGGSAISTYSASVPILAPMGGDNEVNNGMSFKVTGTAPNRVLVVEWNQFYVWYTNISGAGNMQALLYETSGKIDFIYGDIYNSQSSTTTVPIFISASNTTKKSGSVTVGAIPTYDSVLTTPVSNSFAASVLIANLGSTSQGNRVVYTFTPVATTAPTNLTFASITGSGMTLNWIDSPNELGYSIMRSTDGVNYTNITSLAANVVTYPATGLNFGTLYYWKVVAFSEGTTAELANSQATNAGTLSGDKTVGGSGSPNYATLTAAFADINTNGLAGNVNLILQSGYVGTGETYPIAGPGSAPMASYTATVYPAVSGLSITSANTTGTINLNGSKNIIFDGRVLATGTTKDLIIANTNAGTSYAIQFINDANTNTFKYCKINSRNTSVNSATILFNTTTGTNGNDNNTIDNCDIYDGSSTPYNAIYSVGSTTTAATYNSGNIVSNCNIYNFYASASVSSGISLSSGNTDWNITGNNFYQTTSRTGNASFNYGIYISNTGNNFLITGNNIGGGAVSCGGTAWTSSLSGATRFVGIYLSVGTTSPTSVQNNTIANFSFSSSSGAATLPGVWGGIYLVTGNANIGTSTGNTIGSGTGTGSVQVTISTTGGVSFGIASASANTFAISNNTIGSITVLGSSINVSHSFNGIWTTGSATSNTINNNLIGSTATANSINASTASANATGEIVQGILNSGSATAIAITNNTIANLNSNYVPSSIYTTASILKGIASSSGVNTITGNTVRNLSTAAQGTGTTSAASIIGISLTSGTAGTTLSQNTIYALNSTHATAAVCVSGIHYAGATSGTNLIARNLIYGLNIVSSSLTSDLRGLNFASGLANVQNNVIRLGYDATGNVLVTGIPITGLYDVGSSANTGMYFNSVYIGGSSVGTLTGTTYAFRSDVTTTVRTYQNNIFFNGRSNATTGGKHYAVRVSGTGTNPTGLALNYNDYLANGSGAVFGYYNADVASFSAWKTALGTNIDLNSINSDPLYVAATSATPNLSLSAGTPCEGAGIAISGITNDYANATRSSLTPTDIGAYAGNFGALGIDMKPTALIAPIATGCYTAAEAVTVTIVNNSGSVIDFTVNPVTVAVVGSNAASAYTSNLVLSTGTLGIGVSTNVTMPATINMTTAGNYSFNATTSVTGDFNTANDALATQNRSVFGGTYTVGVGGNYTTLTAAVAAYNSTGCIVSPVIFSLTDATYASETFPIKITFNAMASLTNTLTIKPAAGASPVITNSSLTPTLQLDGAKYVIIDGSNATTTKDLTIANTNTGAAPAILFINDAISNTVKYTKISSTNASTTSGSIVFSTTTGTNGNDNNTIDNCNIFAGATTPYNAIYASGTTTTAANYNSGVSITNNNIYDFFYAGGSDNGIYITSGNTEWTITGNSFYQTFSPRTPTTGTTDYAIYISNTSGNNFTVSNNFIGGMSPSCGGAAWTTSGTSFANKFVGIYLSVGTTTPTTVQNNTIQNFYFTSSTYTTMPGVWNGIYLSAGNANIGTVTGNTIGNGTGNASVQIQTSGTGLSSGISSAASGTFAISNNKIGAITTLGTAATVSNSFNGIWSSGGATLATINSNIIGSTITANSIDANNAYTGTTAQYVNGIYNSGTASAISISNNTIANLNSAYVPSAASSSTILRGIYSNSGVNTITGNIIHDLTTAAYATGTTSSASVIGISLTSTTTGICTVSQNTIYGLSNSNAGNYAVCVTGIHYAGPTTLANKIARNLIYGLNIISTAPTADMRGINYSSGLDTVQNNIIRLGYDAAGTELTAGFSITGLYDVGSSANTAMLFNSIYIGGTNVVDGTGPANTYAFRSDQVTNLRTYQNNIFFNARSNGGGTGKHYAVRLAGTTPNPTGLQLNYNDYLANGTGGIFGYYNSLNVADLIAWQTAVGQDANSKNNDPLFVNPTSASPDLHLTTGSPCEGTGLLIAAVSDDFDGESRSGLSPTDIGADAGNYAPTGVDMGVFALIAPAAPSGCYSSHEYIIVTIKNFSADPIDFSVNPVTVAVTETTSGGGFNINEILSSGVLAANATQNVTLTTTIDMTTSANYTFNASTSVGGDINTANDALAPVVRNGASMGGTYLVGTGHTAPFDKLTTAVNLYNATTCFTAAVVFELTDADYSTSETFPIAINANAGASAINTLTIKPASGVTAVITGSSSSIIKLNGADYVTIDGSNNGTTTQNLSIINTNAAASTVVMLSSLGASAGATNNTIKNCIIKAGETGVTSGIYGISVGGATAGSSGADNDNTTIQNNTISKAYIGIWAQGSATSNPGLMDNLQITGNSVGSATVADYIAHDGIMLANATAALVSQNTVYNIITSATTPVGMTIGSGTVSSTVSRNNINNITYNGSSGYGGWGMYVSTANPASNLTIANNVIHTIGGDGWTTFSGTSMVGMYFTGTMGGLNIYYNTVNMDGNFTRSSATLTTAILFDAATITNINLRNNIFVNSMDNTGSTSDKNYAFYSSAPNTSFTNINYNDYYVSGAQGVLGYIASADVTTLAAWKTSTTKDTNSINVPAVFISATDLHLNNTSNDAINNKGVSIAAVTIDMDGAARDALNPDMGAYEVTPPGCAGAIGGTATGSATYCGSGTPVITASGYSYGTGSTYQWQSSIDLAFTTPVDIGGQITPASLTAGTVTTTTYYRLKAMCSSGTAIDYSTIVTISIIPKPTVGVTPTTTQFCTSGSQLLTASGADSYNWSPTIGLNASNTASVTATPSVTTKYTVTGLTTATGCTNTATATINVVAGVSATTTPTTTTICSGSNAQLQVVGNQAYNNTVNGYSFVGSTGTYSVITGTTLTTSTYDDDGVGNLPIGFTFNYNGTDHTIFGMRTNGLIELDQASATLSGYSSNALATTAKCIAPLWDDNNTTGGSMIYSTTGSAGSQVLTVQWTGLHVAGSGSSSNPTIDMQIKLYEGSNKIEFIYGNTSAPLSSPSASIGISGAVGNFISVTPLSPANTSTTSILTENSSIGSAANFPIGTLYTFTPALVPAYTYSWSPTTFIPSGQEITSNPLATALSGTTTYTATVTGNFGCTATAITTVTVDAATVAGSIAVSATPILGGQSTTLSISGNTGNNTGWEAQQNGGGWSAIANTNPSYSPFPTALGTWNYRALIKSGVCPAAYATQGDVLVNANYTTFTAGVNNDWNTAGNWDRGIPSRLYDATIPFNLLAVVNESGHECNNLTLAPKAELTAVDVNFWVFGTLTLQSNATGTASLKETGTITYAHPSTAQCFLSGNAFHQLSIPISDAIQPGSAAGQTGDVFLYCSLDKYDETTANYVGLTATSTITANQGYVVEYYPGSGPANKTLSFTGALNTGDKSFVLTYSGVGFGYNLVPNPYPSGLDWDQSNMISNATATQGASAPIYIWNGNTANWGSYVSGNAGIGTLASNIIPPMQSFFVKATAAGSFTIPNMARVHPGAQGYMKTTPSDILKLRVSSTMNTYIDELIVNFKSNATPLQGAAKWFSFVPTAPSLYSVKSNTNFAINTLTAISNNLVVPVGFKAGVNGNYTIKASELNSFAPSTYIYLKDLSSNTLTDLNQNASYSFAAATTDIADRFQLIFAYAPLGISNNSAQNTGIYSYENTIFVNSSEHIQSIAIYNALGQLIKSFANASAKMEIDMKGQAMGYYIVRVVTDKNAYSEKLLIK